MNAHFAMIAHLFNHETHHRGQAHAILTSLGIAEPEPFDLLIMQRELARLACFRATRRAPKK